MIPMALRKHLGLQPGEVEVTAEGAALRVEAIAGEGLVERDGRLIIPATGATVDDESVRELRDAWQR